jgi:signal transduction histidine kinase
MAVFKISDLTVAAVVGALMGPDIILLIIYQVVAEPRLELVVVDPYRISLNYYTCVTNSSGPILLWIIFGIHMATFAVGAYLAWKVRLIPYKIYDESKSIAFSIYNVGFFGVILAVILNVAQASHYVLFGLLVFLCVAGSLITVNVLFGSKLYWVKRGFDSSTSSGGSSRTTTGSGGYTAKSSLGNHMSSPMTSSAGKDSGKLESAQNRIEKLEKRIKKMKKSLREYEERERRRLQGDNASDAEEAVEPSS